MGASADNRRAHTTFGQGRLSTQLKRTPHMPPYVCRTAVGAFVAPVVPQHSPASLPLCPPQVSTTKPSP